MYWRVIACDFEGTGATDGHPAPDLYAALAATRALGDRHVAGDPPRAQGLAVAMEPPD